MICKYQNNKLYISICLLYSYTFTTKVPTLNITDHLSIEILIDCRQKVVCIWIVDKCL